MSKETLVASITQIAVRVSELHEEMTSTESRIQEARKQVSSLQKQYAQLEQELRNERNALIYALERGEDPVAVKISHSVKEIEAGIAESVRKEDNTWDLDSDVMKKHDYLMQALQTQMDRKKSKKTSWEI